MGWTGRKPYECVATALRGKDAVATFDLSGGVGAGAGLCRLIGLGHRGSDLMISDKVKAKSEVLDRGTRGAGIWWSRGAIVVARLRRGKSREGGWADKAARVRLSTYTVATGFSSKVHEPTGLYG